MRYTVCVCVRVRVCVYLVRLQLYGPVVAGGGVPQQADALVLQDLLAERRLLPPQGVDPPHAVGLVHGGVQSLQEIRCCRFYCSAHFCCLGHAVHHSGTLLIGLMLPIINHIQKITFLL